jgi:TolR protein
MAMGTLGGAGDEDDALPMSEINVTPLVDVMLVLLIIFMVAAPMMMVGVPVQLPRTAAPRVAQTAPPIVVSIDGEGRVFLRREEVPEAEIAQRIAALREEEGGEAPVYVRGDRTVPYGTVMRVMGRVSQSGVARVSLIAEAEPGGSVLRSR